MLISQTPLTYVVALIVASIAAVTDIRTGKIFNVLTFPSMLLGMLLLGVTSGMTAGNVGAGFSGALQGLLGCLSGMAIMIGMKLFLRALGHGDTKLMGAIGAFVGPLM